MSSSVGTIALLLAALAFVIFATVWLVNRFFPVTPRQTLADMLGWTGLLDEKTPADMDYEDVEEIVLRVLERDMLCRPRETSWADADIVRDLNADGDDLSFLFIPVLEERFGVRPTFDDWGNVRSVTETARMLYRHVQQAKAAPR